MTALIPLMATLTVVVNQAPERIEIRQGLWIGSVGRGGRVPFPIDPIQQRLVDGTFRFPTEGETVRAANGQDRAWSAATAAANGWFQGPNLQGGWLAATVDAPAPRIMILRAAGHTLAVVNGVLRSGDRYAYDYVHTPVALKAGRNELLFPAGRGRVRASLEAPPAPIYLNVDDPTLPDFVLGERGPERGAVLVVNATPRWQRGVRLTANTSGRAPIQTEVPAIPPLGYRKIGFAIPRPTLGQPGEAAIRLTLQAEGSLHRREIRVRVRRPDQVHKRTFVSGIDGSTQYYAVHPRKPGAMPDREASLVLSLHGASVEALGQAEAYGQQDWATLVAPTNRRPFGFDWEDWGRMDAIEVLEHAQARIPHDPRRVYLTGHSMGGHGTWHLGVTFPDRFAAVGPSAGWVSFFSYAGGVRVENPDPMVALFQAATNPSDTLALQRNLTNSGVYILHGDADDNVPVTEARTMRDALRPWHPDLGYHEQPGAGHWWDSDDRPGASCVDWLPMWQHFQRRRLPDWSREDVTLEFTTMNPAISSRYGPLDVLRLDNPTQGGQLQGRWRSSGRSLEVTTRNVAELGFRFSDPVDARVDGQRFRVSRGLRLERVAGRWRPMTRDSRPRRAGQMAGPFKQAFANRFALVIPTAGSPEITEWALRKARFDLETWQYQGNGDAEILTDREALAQGNRNLILYGCETSNRVWARLSPRLPFRLAGAPDRALMMLYPDGNRLIGFQGGTTPRARRSLDRLPVFLSGVAYPDWVWLSPDVWTRGTGAVYQAGFFGPDWTVRRGISAGEPVQR